MTPGECGLQGQPHCGKVGFEPQALKEKAISSGRIEGSVAQVENARYADPPSPHTCVPREMGASVLLKGIVCASGYILCEAASEMKCGMQDVYESALEMCEQGEERKWLQGDVRVQCRPSTSFGWPHREFCNWKGL